VAGLGSGGRDNPVAMSETTLPCPRCGDAMRHLALAAHLGRTVEVDHCSGCRLVWFDTLESVALAPLGWVALLRELQIGSGLVLPDARSATLACPHCTSPFKTVHNRTRFGAFAALECPRGHGHLHSHTGLLAERGLARPLLPAERDALQRGRKALACVNCGAPADGRAASCTYCASPIVVIDLPRLMHALTNRLADNTPSPRADGRAAPWHCIACGTSLDVARQAQCPACGTAAVAPSLPEIEPLLDAAEAELKTPPRRSAEAAAATRALSAEERRRWRTADRGDWRATQLARLRHWFEDDRPANPLDDWLHRHLAPGMPLWLWHGLPGVCVLVLLLWWLA
jgi:DNA-directed RNA polymerase subunit RPC12/RpoP